MQFWPPSSAHFVPGQHILRLAGPGVWEVSSGPPGHYAAWWKMAAVNWSASYINQMEKKPVFFILFYKVVEQSSPLRAVEWLSVCFECPLLDRCSSNNGRHGYGGGRQTYQSQRSQYTSIWGSCQSPERCSNGTVVTGERGRGRENDLVKTGRRRGATSPRLVLKSPLLELVIPLLQGK